jgi:hypothetical protein
MNLSEQVRELVRTKYVRPALAAGRRRFSVAVRDLLPELVSQGFPHGNTPQICTAPRKASFLREEGIEIESIDGPPSKMSTSVVFHFRVSGSSQTIDLRSIFAGDSAGLKQSEESPEDRANRLTGKLRGLLKQEIAEYGGGEAFLRRMREDDEKDTA